jgi:acetyl/propionyl-CoA carboxylase alpha subunit
LERPIVKRVLIANRGEIARRLIRHFRAQGVETVSVFSEPDVEQPWVEEADFSVYLNGATVADTYLNADKVVGAAMDAGADAIHPGYCFLADRPAFYTLCEAANMFVYGAGSSLLDAAGDRITVRELGRELELDVVPGSDVLTSDMDVVAEAVQVGFPLYVKAQHSSQCCRVEHLGDLGEALVSLQQQTKDAVFLERAIDRLRYISVVVVGDDEVGSMPLGIIDSSIRVHQQTWIEEMGPEVVPGEFGLAIQGASVALADHLGWRGVGRVRWALSGGTVFLIGFTPRLPTGYSLTEAVHGLDLIEVQANTLTGAHLGWGHLDTQPNRAGLQLRLFHVPSTPSGARDEGELEVFELPSGEGLIIESGTEAGLQLGPHTEPLLAKITVLAPTRQAAIVKARHALDAVEIRGVEHNLDALRWVLEDPEYWAGDYHLDTLRQRSERSREK